MILLGYLIDAVPLVAVAYGLSPARKAARK